MNADHPRTDPVQDAGAPLARRRETPMGVVGVGLALLLLLGLFASQLASPVREADGLAALTEAFEVDAASTWPAGTGVTDAMRLPDGRLLVRLLGTSDPQLPEGHDGADGNATPDEGSAPAGAGEPSGSGAPGGFGMGAVWSGLQERGQGGAPNQVVLVRYLPNRAERVLRQQFGELKFQDLMMLGKDGGSVPLASGHEPWGPYEVRWAHLRHFQERDGVATFHDSLRVNLTVGRRAWVLYLSWPERERGGLEAARPWLAVLRPRPPQG